MPHTDVGRSEDPPGHAERPAVMGRHRTRHALRERTALRRPQRLGELAGVNADRAGRGAQPVGGAGVEPLVQRERDQNFHSVFITQPGSRISTLADLKGHSFAFGDVNSTSGHLMPAYYMRAAGIDPGALAKTVYTGGHDATALAVANGKVDAGAMDELVLGNMLKSGKIVTNQAKVFYTTPPFFDYVWAARKGLDSKLRDGFTAAFLKLDASNAENKVLLDLLNATKYVRAEDASYDKLRQAAHAEGLLQ